MGNREKCPRKNPQTKQSAAFRRYAEKGKKQMDQAEFQTLTFGLDQAQIGKLAGMWFECQQAASLKTRVRASWRRRRNGCRMIWRAPRIWPGSIGGRCAWRPIWRWCADRGLAVEVGAALVEDAHYPDGAVGDPVNEGVGELLEDAFPGVVFTGAEFKAEFSNPGGLPVDGVHGFIGQAFARFFEVVFFDLVQVAQGAPGPGYLKRLCGAF